MYKIALNQIIDRDIETGVAEYHRYCKLEQMKSLWKKIWALKIPPKVQVYAWRAYKDVLPAKLRLLSNGKNFGVDYYLCPRDEESSQHLLLECLYMTHAIHVVGILEHPLRITREDTLQRFTTSSS